MVTAKGKFMTHWKRNFIFLAQGQFVSILGDKAFNTAAIILLSFHMDSGIMASIYSAVPIILSLTLMLVGGAIADSFSKKMIMIVSDLISGFMVLSFGIFLLSFNQTSLVAFIFLTVIKAILSIVNSFFLPASEGLIAEILPQDKVIKGRSMLTTSSQLASFVGPGIAALIVKVFSLPYLFIIDGISYLFSALSELFIQVNNSQEEKDHHDSFSEILIKVKEGFFYTFNEKGLSFLIFLLLVINFFSAPISVLNGFYIKYHLNLGEEWIGNLLSAFAFGSILGSILSTRLNDFSQKIRFYIFITIIPLFGLILFGIAFSKNIYFSLLCIASFSFLSVPLNILIMAQIQLRTAPKLISRVMSTTIVMANIVAPIAIGLAGILVDLLKNQIFVIYLGMGIPFFILLPVLITSKQLREFFIDHV